MFDCRKTSKKNARYNSRDYLFTRIKAALSSDLMTRWRLVSWPADNVCTTTATVEYQSTISLSDMQGSFYILGIGKLPLSFLTSSLALSFFVDLKSTLPYLMECYPTHLQLWRESRNL